MRDLSPQQIHKLYVKWLQIIITFLPFFSDGVIAEGIDRCSLLFAFIQTLSDLETIAKSR